jgi:hypothetical protein
MSSRLHVKTMIQTGRTVSPIPQRLIYAGLQLDDQPARSLTSPTSRRVTFHLVPEVDWVGREFPDRCHRSKSLCAGARSAWPHCATDRLTLRRNHSSLPLPSPSFRL